MKQFLRDALVPGTLLWLLGYLASIALFFTPLSGVLGWILLVIFTPVTTWVAWQWFRGRDLPLSWYAGVGVAWAAIAVVLDYCFIVLLFSSPEYYKPDVFIYYALMVAIPVGVGVRIRQKKTGPDPTSS